MRIYLVSTEDLYRGRAQVHVRRLLISYWGKEDRFDVALRCADSPEDWCVDSGAHFYISAFFKHGRKLPVSVVEEHVDRMLRWLRRLERKPRWVVEMDLQDIYGVEQIMRWREDVWKPFERETGIRVCYNQHIQDPLELWPQLVADPDVRYLALSVPKNKDLVPYARMVYLAYEAGVPVHGFAQVKEHRLRAIPFASVDSTSWGSGSLFGSVHSFEKGKNKTRGAGRSVWRDDPNKALAALTMTGGRVRMRDVLGVKAGGSLSRVYQNAADAFDKMESWYTAYWRVKGVDWEGLD